MKNLKEYFKQRLLEDIGAPELMKAIEAKHDAKGTDPSDQLNQIATSRFLYVSDPNDPSKPVRVHGVVLHPDLTTALANAAHHGIGIKPEYVKMIKAFIEQHGHFVGADGRDDIAYPPKFSTKDPSGVLSNIFGSTLSRRRR
jgi:hypothetical protein